MAGERWQGPTLVLIVMSAIICFNLYNAWTQFLPAVDDEP
jgi:hypothetical protein